MAQVVTVERSAPVEFRYAGGWTIVGPAMRYGEQAADRRERFEAGAFVARADPLPLHLQHDPSVVVATTADRLTVMDGPAMLEARAELLEASAALELVKRRRLTGYSIEFRALAEDQISGVRVIHKAHLEGIGLVDVPSYAGSRVELRQAFDSAWLTASIPTGERLQCECAPGDCQDVEFEDGAFDGLGDDGDILAVGGPFTRVLGSLRRGTLVTEKTDVGLRIGLTGPTDTAAAREVIDNARTAPIYARPLLDPERSEYVEDGPIQRFSRASVRAFLIKATPNDRGHIPAEVEGAEPRARRRRLWL